MSTYSQIQLITKYFPDLSPKQFEQFEALQPLYAEWNEKINVISRKDIENLYERHVLHSLSIAAFAGFRKATKVMDLGTGGGFPGIPLAIMFPECRFHLVDSIGKKLKVVKGVAETIGLNNVECFHERAENMPYTYDYVVSRAVAPLSDLLAWSKKKYSVRDLNKLPNGLICLKGGDIDAEIAASGKKSVKKVPIANYFQEEYFADKFIVYVQQ